MLAIPRNACPGSDFAGSDCPHTVLVVCPNYNLASINRSELPEEFLIEFVVNCPH